MLRGSVKLMGMICFSTPSSPDMVWWAMKLGKLQISTGCRSAASLLPTACFVVAAGEVVHFCPRHFCLLTDMVLPGVWCAADWRKELDDVRSKFPMRYPDRDDVIAPQHAVEVRHCQGVLSCSACGECGCCVRVFLHRPECAMGVAKLAWCLTHGVLCTCTPVQVL